MDHHTHASISETPQIADLMQAWAPIAIADALELLSPDFPNDQVMSTLYCGSPYTCKHASNPLGLQTLSKPGLPLLLPMHWSSSLLGSLTIRSNLVSTFYCGLSHTCKHTRNPLRLQTSEFRLPLLLLMHLSSFPPISPRIR